jgi:hypothetical protein
MTNWWEDLVPGLFIGQKDKPAAEGKHVGYKSDEWLDMLVDARQWAAGYREDPCAEVEANLKEMKRQESSPVRTVRDHDEEFFTWWGSTS